jgi:hypothetical protein
MTSIRTPQITKQPGVSDEILAEDWNSVLAFTWKSSTYRQSARYSHQPSFSMGSVSADPHSFDMEFFALLQLTARLPLTPSGSSSDAITL